MISSNKPLAEIKEEMKYFEEYAKKYNVYSGLVKRELNSFNQLIKTHEKNLKDENYDKNLLGKEIEKTEKDWTCFQERWSSLCPTWLNFVLDELKKEILDYEKTMDQDKTRYYLDRQGYYRVIDVLNSVLAKEKPCPKDINYLQQIWKGSVKKDFHKIPTSFLRRNEWLKRKKESMDRDWSQKKTAFFQDIFAVVTIVIGVYLGLATKNPIVFLLILFAAMVLMSECAKTKNRAFIDRDRKSYLLTPKAWSMILGTISSITAAYLFFQEIGTFNLVLFTGTTIYLCLSIYAFEKQLPPLSS